MPRTAIRKTRALVQRRSEIAFAAAEAISRHGVNATTMQEIAKACGYTAASLYTYFDSKEALVEALFDAVRAEILAAFDTAFPSGTSFAQRLELLVLAQFALVERRRDAIAVFHAASADVACDPRDHFEIEERLAKWMRVNAAPRDLWGNDPSEAARVLGGILRSFIEDWMFRKNPKPLTPRAPDAVRWFLHGVSGKASR